MILGEPASEFIGGRDNARRREPAAKSRGCRPKRARFGADPVVHVRDEWENVGVERCAQGFGPACAVARARREFPSTRELGRVNECRDEAVGPLTGDPKQPRTVSCEPYGRTGPLDGLWPAGCVAGAPIWRCRPGLVPERFQYVQRLDKPRGALCGARKRDPVGGMLRSIRAGTEADDKAPLGDHVNGSRHLRGKCRWPVRRRQDSGSEPDAPRQWRKGGKRRKAVKRIITVTATRCPEVIVDPEPIESEAFREKSTLEERGPRAGVLPNTNAKSEGGNRGRHPVRLLRAEYDDDVRGLELGGRGCDVTAGRKCRHLSNPEVFGGLLGRRASTRTEVDNRRAR